jgi:L-histidine Nalpha-methyltransferase / hercynylcysteine S-oxide synthase
MTVDISSKPPTAAAVENWKATASSKRGTTIIDIRTERDEYSILQDIKTGLRPHLGQAKTLPTLLLYDVNGLRLFERITYLEEYYLTNTEIEVLEKYAGHIAERIQPNSIVLELGSG